MRMAERLYTMPPGERLGYLETIIRLARDGHSPLVRDILTTPKLIKPNPNDRWLFFRSSPGVYCTISQAANRYTLWSPWAAPIALVVRGEVPEPPTGVIEEDGTTDNGRGFLKRKSGDTLNKGDFSDRPNVHPWYNSGDEYPNKIRPTTPTQELAV